VSNPGETRTTQRSNDVRSLAKVAASGAALVALGLGGSALAGAATSSPAGTTLTGRSIHARPACHAPAPGTAAHEDAEKVVTGAAATQARAAAVKAVGGGTAGTVSADFTGTGYETTVTKPDGTKVGVQLDRALRVMQLPGGHAGHRPLCLRFCPHPGGKRERTRNLQGDHRMKAVTFHGRRDVRVDQVPDPRIQEPTDAIVRITSTAICGSDLHLYEVLGPFIDEGDILGHEPMGVVEEVGADVKHIKPGDRVVIPFNISCGHCYMCDQGLFAQCETTQVRELDKGAALFGYTKLYGQVPGGQAELLRVPQAHFGPIKLPENGHPDERFLYLSDVLPTSWQAVEFAAVPPGGSVAVYGLGPIGQMCARVARHRGAQQVIGVDIVPERLEMARRHGVEAIDARQHDAVPAVIRDMTGGRGPDSVIDAVGMEAHGAPVGEMAQKATALLPKKLAAAVTERFAIDRLEALLNCIDTVRRGGTLSISGVYGGQLDPLPMMQLFDKGIQIRMGQAHVKRWTDEIMPLLTGDDDPLGTDDLATHKLPLEQAPQAYEMFQQKKDGAIKVVLKP
jgi:threonine dehydrogenase-like Zn-dependent dehydrogenase